MSSFVMTQQQLDNLGAIAEQLSTSAQALVDLVASVRDNQVDEQAMQAARNANVAIQEANDVRQRASAGEAISQQEAEQAERQLVDADQSVEQQLASLRETVAGHGRQLEEQGGHIGRIQQVLNLNDAGESQRLNDIEQAQLMLAEQLHGNDDDSDNTPGLVRRVDNVEADLAELRENGVGWQPDTGRAGLIALVTFLVAWLIFALMSASLGWQTAWVPALMLATAAFMAGVFYSRHRDSDARRRQLPIVIQRRERPDTTNA